ncbi:16S rRNA (cytosine(967)-C(5))-methyltransferase RsmB [Bordetella genomosp. 11]|uniref:16S rRNA (Cytosine(967)-C(5))-methyltransferase n=1 Tax=Bordetella genomosp. 11 TaxID=1416808 RepID=A0A261ULV3_9BORD|nr:16S rRNA (cytosine(967)-C(5))-methyltransferase RsmB [Bordetella genomosp. 11]OZI62864.1 16S rRNA (cytosine(967)-C(5))-methyltransferase [Bordetella genomosp. 11]
MSDSTSSPAAVAAPLRDLLAESAGVVRAVLAGRSMTDAIGQVPAPLRAGTQALSFHTMRRLGEARAARRILVPRTPPEPLAEALLLVSLALLLPGPTGAAAIEHAPQAPFYVPPGITQAIAPETAGTPAAGAPAYAPYTVVDQAVEAAGRLPRVAPLKGLVNGALRSFLRDRDTLLPQLSRQIEARWNHPQWWVDKLRSAYPDAWESILAAANVPAPMTLRVNCRRATREQVLAAFLAAGVDGQPAGAAGIVLAQPRPVQRLPGFEDGWWSVQDAGAQLAAPLLGVKDGMRVLDACAAPGGKTAHLLELADIDLLALDADAGRLRRVGDNLRRLGLDTPRVSLRAGDAANPDDWWDGQPFDAVLADVPCTASGIVRRHPDIRWLRRPDDVPRTVKLQTRIVDALWRTVAPGGRLLYVTCSVFPEEGERQAAAFAARHADARRLEAPGQLLPVAAGATETAQHDGFFYALFAKAT